MVKSRKYLLRTIITSYLSNNFGLYLSLLFFVFRTVMDAMENQ